jgi:hypothetical protein
MRLLKGNKITEKEIAKILNIVIDAKETRKLKGEVISLIKEEIQQLNFIKKCRNTLGLLLESAIENL